MQKILVGGFFFRGHGCCDVTTTQTFTYWTTDGPTETEIGWAKKTHMAVS